MYIKYSIIYITVYILILYSSYNKSRPSLNWCYPDKPITMLAPGKSGEKLCVGQ